MDVAHLVHAEPVLRVRWPREPLWHFVALGVLLVAAYRVLAPAPSADHIVVTAALRRALAEEHERRFTTPPTAEQLAAAVDRWVDDEVRVREALALGLDRDDLIVRRRLIQKMDFVLEDATPLARATDAELAAFLAAHADRYATPARVSLVHVFAAGDRHGADAETIAAGWRERLAAGAPPETLGDPFVRGRELRLQTESELAGVFGPDFAATAMTLPLDVWSAPVRSAFGVHLVRITQRSAGAAPELAAVRAQVERDWHDERRAALDREALAQLRARYRVEHEGAGP